MGQGFLQVKVMKENREPIAGARVAVRNSVGVLVYDVRTDSSGNAPLLTLEAPDAALTLDPSYRGLPFSTYDMVVNANGFIPIYIHNVEILDTQLSTLPVIMHTQTSDGTGRDEIRVEHIFITSNRGQFTGNSFG